MAIAAAARRANCDEYRFRTRQRLFQIEGERQPTRFHVLGHQLIQAGLENRDLAVQQGVDLRLVLVDTDHLVPEIGKTGTRDQAHIARADHHNTHRNP